MGRADTAERLLTIKEYADEWRVHTRTVRRWIRAQHITAERTGDHGQWRIRVVPVSTFANLTPR